MLGTVAMANTKPRRPPIEEKPSAVPKTQLDRVDHPRLAGLVETVHRVTDTLSAMFKRKQIGEREYMAAEKYRTCFAALYGQMGGVGDFERSRGGSNPGSPPAPHFLLAAEAVSEVRKYLYPKDFCVVYRVVALGMTIEQATEQLYDPVTRASKEDCGRRLREGLSQMADRWYPENQGAGHRMRSHVSERAQATDIEAVPQANVAHATRDKVYRSGK